MGEEQVFCHSCGKPIQEDSVFCRHCGARQEAGKVQKAASEAATALAPNPEPDTNRDAFTYKVIGGVVGFLVLITVVSNLSGPAQAPGQAAPDAAIDAATDAGVAADAAAGAALKDAVPTSSAAGRWSYSEDEDKVRGTKTFYATTTSTNTVYQAPPYDAATTMDITIRQSSKSGTDVMFIISSGQMMCPSYEGCSATVRLDDGKPERISLNGASDNSSETVFVVGSKSFVARLKKAKHLVVEKTLFQAGAPQFEFDVGGLAWDH